MRLHRHDEIEDAIAAAISKCVYVGDEIPAMAAAALDAMLEAVVRLEVGELTDMSDDRKLRLLIDLEQEP